MIKNIYASVYVYYARQDIKASNVFTENSDMSRFHWFEHITIKEHLYMACKCICFEKPCSDAVFFES